MCNPNERKERISEIKSAINVNFGGTEDYLDVIDFARNHIDPLNPPTVKEFLDDWEVVKFFRQTIKATQEDYDRGLLARCNMETMFRHPAMANIDITQVACDLEANAKAPKPFDKAPGVGC